MIFLSFFFYFFSVYQKLKHRNGFLYVPVCHDCLDADSDAVFTTKSPSIRKSSFALRYFPVTSKYSQLYHRKRVRCFPNDLVRSRFRFLARRIIPQIYYPKCYAFFISLGYICVRWTIFNQVATTCILILARDVAFDNIRHRSIGKKQSSPSLEKKIIRNFILRIDRRSYEGRSYAGNWLLRSTAIQVTAF